MKAQHVHKKTENTINQLTTYAVCKKLVKNVTSQATRSSFFHVLVHEIKNLFRYDRLCINLYDSERGILSLFTNAEGTVISTLSTVRMLKGTVAELAISSRKAVVLEDINQYFPATRRHPLSEAGLKSTIAIPLMVDKEILGTLHCSFARPPTDLVAILSFLVELGPVLALCLFTVLTEERLSTMALQRPIVLNTLKTKEKNCLFRSSGMRAVMAEVDSIAGLDVPVLILGETGTGKSLLAQYIHEQSTRSGANFVKVNCPSLAPSLFESEFFGHAKGAFTNACTKRMGRLEMAHRGTLFLDEIAELSLEMQSKLLQVLDEQRFERVGESMSVSVDIRLVAATNAHIGDAIARQSLRQDLYYRLAAVIITLPPLRDRPEDIPALAQTLVRQQARALGTEPPHLAPAILADLQKYSWPGNIRELRNIMTRFTIQRLTKGASAQNLRDVMHTLLTHPKNAVTAAQSSAAAPDAPHFLGTASTLAAQEAHALARKEIEEALHRTQGILAGPDGAAALLGIPRTTLQYRIRKWGIAIPSPSPEHK